MATVRKTITLTDQQDDWIKSQVERGDYTNDSEYIRDLIRRKQESTNWDSLRWFLRISRGLYCSESGSKLVVSLPRTRPVAARGG